MSKKAEDFCMDAHKQSEKTPNHEGLVLTYMKFANKTIGSPP